MSAPPAHDAAALTALIARAHRAGRGLPPVDRWEPPFCGDIDMEIRRDGSWHYMGSPIGRQAMVELFSSVLRKDADGRTYLVTPVEKLGIRVEDAPFTIVELDCDGDGPDRRIVLRSNVGELVTAGPDHPLRFETDPVHGGLKPYVRVRGRLDALFTRAAMLHLVSLGAETEIDGRAVFAVRSGGLWFPVMTMAALEGASL